MAEQYPSAKLVFHRLLFVSCDIRSRRAVHIIGGAKSAAVQGDARSATETRQIVQRESQNRMQKVTRLAVYNVDADRGRNGVPFNRNSAGRRNGNDHYTYPTYEYCIFA